MRTLLLGVLLTLPAVALARPVSVTTADDTTLTGEAWGEGARGVVLVHDAGRSHADWALFGERLGERGFNVIALDLRGHGEGATTPVAEDTYPKMVADVAASVSWVRAHGATSVHVLGAGFGANLAVNAAAEDPSITDLVLLSPGMNLHGVASPNAFEAYGDRPALAVSASSDAYATRSVDVLERKAQGHIYVERIDGNASGVVMMNRDPQLEGKLVAWLNGTYDLHGQREHRDVSSENAGDVETSGVRFGHDD